MVGMRDEVEVRRRRGEGPLRGERGHNHRGTQQSEHRRHGHPLTSHLHNTLEEPSRQQQQAGSFLSNKSSSRLQVIAGFFPLQPRTKVFFCRRPAGQGEEAWSFRSTNTSKGACKKEDDISIEGGVGPARPSMFLFLWDIKMPYLNFIN